MSGLTCRHLVVPHGFRHSSILMVSAGRGDGLYSGGCGGLRESYGGADECGSDGCCGGSGVLLLQCDGGSAGEYRVVELHRGHVGALRNVEGQGNS